MKESYRLTINKGLRLHFNYVQGTFEVIVDVRIPNSLLPPTDVYAKIWEIDLEDADLIVGLLRNSLEEPFPGKHLFTPDYSMFFVRRTSDTVFLLHIHTLGGNSFWTYLTCDQVKELQTIMQQISTTLAKEQE